MFAPPMKSFIELTGMKNADDVMGTPTNERYTYLFDMNSQALDHMLLSPALQKKWRLLGYEHLHLNTWASSGDEVSDHDPTMMSLYVCEC